MHCDLLPTVWTDSMQLGRVFQNLIENACKYSRKNVDSEITISARDTEDNTVFSVSDNGIGIKEDDTLRIFTLFQRVDEADQKGGRGIGLGTARKIIESMGGKIWVKSRINKESTFSFSIPKPKELEISTGSKHRTQATTLHAS